MHPLTDAFIKGRSKFAKVQGTYTDKTKNPKKMCHLGAMYWGVYSDASMNMISLKQDFPQIADHFVPLPCSHFNPRATSDSDSYGHISTILIHLNDVHDGRDGWGTEEVSKWLDKVLTADAGAVQGA